jgi:hypothetical protein
MNPEDPREQALEIGAVATSENISPPSPPPIIKKPNVAPSLKPRLPSRKVAEGIGEDLLEPGEELVTVIKRHPIGIIGFYIEAFVALVLIIGFGVFIVNVLGNGISKQSTGWLIGTVVFSIAVVTFFLFVATYVYRQNRIILTDRSLIQILQKSLFIRKVSRLSLSNVEDVNAESRGILASIFGYGTLNIQTAGALENFSFPFCPNPTVYADKIIEARQRYAVALEENQEDLPFFASN